MKQILIFLAGSLVILFSLGLILSANIFGIIFGVLVLIGFSVTDLSEKYWEICSRLTLESRE